MDTPSDLLYRVPIQFAQETPFSNATAMSQASLEQSNTTVMYVAIAVAAVLFFMMAGKR